MAHLSSLIKRARSLRKEHVWAGHFQTNASWGLVARNTLYSGNAAHWFNQVHQICFEDNHWIGVAIQACA